MADTLEGFEEFWEVYPRKVAKLAAARMYEKALKLTDAGTILRGAQRYARERQGADPQFTAHPATWLNAGRWDDEPQPENRNGRRYVQNSLLGALDRLEERLANAADDESYTADLLSLPPR